MTNIIIHSGTGDTFNEVSIKAKEAAGPSFTAEFEFNGITCFVNKDTDLELLLRDYYNTWIMDWKAIGPNCVAEYSKEIQLEIEKRTEASEASRAASQAAYDADLKTKKEALLEKIKDIPFSCINKDALALYKEKNTDSYGGACISYADYWGRLMQLEMKDGVALIDIAEKTSSEADVFGLTGFMYGAAVKVLFDTWEHGEELRVWHNAQYNHTGAGVVNPAIFTIG